MGSFSTLSQLETQTRRLADLENATGRFPPSEVWNYVNAGIRFVFRTLITVGDKPYYMKDAKFTCTSQVTVYPLPPDYLRMMSVLYAASGLGTGPWRELEPYTEAERVRLLNAGYYGGVWPSMWGIVGGTGAYTQGTTQTAMSIEILPAPTGSSVIQLRYIPNPPSLQQATDVFDGIAGYEDAVCTWAAILMRRKDDLDTTELERDMERHMNEIRMIGRKRDGSRPPRVSLVRARTGNRGWRGGGWGGGWGGGSGL